MNDVMPIIGCIGAGFLIGCIIYLCTRDKSDRLR